MNDPADRGLEQGLREGIPSMSPCCSERPAAIDDFVGGSPPTASDLQSLAGMACRKFHALLTALLLSVSTTCIAAEAKFGSIVLMQPDSELRAKQIDANQLAGYIKSVQAEILIGVGTKALPRSSGFVVFAVRDSGESRVWLDMKPAWPEEKAATIFAAARKVPAFPVGHGDVVFAIKLSIDGAGETPGNMPMPSAWRNAIRDVKQPLPVEQVVGLAWPRQTTNRSGAVPGRATGSAAEGPRSTIFERQRLEVTEGSVEKPRHWFYSHRTDGKSITWTLSKEDSRAGQPYQTGFRIQFIPSAAAVLKMPPERFAENLIEQKKAAAQVIRHCPRTVEGDQMRRCIETIEGPFRILYSLIWSEKLDHLVVTTFGTPVSDWETLRPVAERMSTFTLLGEAFWKKSNTRNSRSPVLAKARYEEEQDQTAEIAKNQSSHRRGGKDARECLLFDDPTKLRACAERFR
jgi:hypothetical protein